VIIARTIIFFKRVRAGLCADRPRRRARPPYDFKVVIGEIYQNRFRGS